MARTKTKIKTKTKTQPKTKVETAARKLPKHGDLLRVPVDHMEPNSWNPNVMSPEEFDALGENIDKIDFLDPVLVTFDRWLDDGTPFFRIIDGEHRWQHARLEDMVDLPVIYADPERVPEIEQRKQTVKMNVLHGKPDKRKLLDLVEWVMDEEQKPMEEVARDMGFLDFDVFQKMIDDARENLPTDDMKKEFDKAKDELKTVDDLSTLLNRLFTRYGDTLPANFMILDFGGKQHIWVRMDPKSLKVVQSLARDCLEQGVTFDSVVFRSLMLIDDSALFVEEHRPFLELLQEEESIDEMLGEDDAGTDET